MRPRAPRKRHPAIEMRVCSEKGCSAVATSWACWPGRKTAVCGPCAVLLSNSAAVKGFGLELKPIDYEHQQREP